MNKYKQTFAMFHGNQITDFLEHNSKMIKYEIDETREDYILNVNEEEYTNYCVQHFTIDTPHIDFDSILIDSYKDEISAEYFSITHPGMSYQRQVIVYYLPYTGNPKLFKYRPRTYQLWFPEVYLQGQNVCFDVINFNNNPDEIRREAERIIESIKFLIANIIQEIDAYNS
jgi:hypothetical protein